MHDPTWYEAWPEARACKTPLCLTMGAPYFKGLCWRCFAIQYPTGTSRRDYKCKETEFALRIAARFPQFQSRFDKHILDRREPGGPRPDAMPTGLAPSDAAGDLAYDVENDEYSHRGATCAGEWR